MVQIHLFDNTISLSSWKKYCWGANLRTRDVISQSIEMPSVSLTLRVTEKSMSSRLEACFVP